MSGVWRIVVDAAVALLASLELLVALRKQFKIHLGEAAIMAGTAGLSVLIWRSFANTPTLNNDPIPPISPNDTLSPVIASVALGMTAAFSRPHDEVRWARARPVLALVVFVVNVCGDGLIYCACLRRRSPMRDKMPWTAAARSTFRTGVRMPKDVYFQPDAPDPVLSEEVVLSLVRRHVPTAQALRGVDESGGEARTYAVDEDLILKVQRPQQLRPRTSLEKEVFFLRQLEAVPDISVPRVLGYGHDSNLLEYTVMTRMPGVAMRHVTLSEDERAEVLEHLGRTLRRIHLLPQTPFFEQALFPGDRSFAAVQQRFREYFVELADRFETRGISWPLSVSLPEIGEQVLASLPANEERVALHSNPYAEHTFVDPETRRFVGLIDFGDAYLSHPAFDMRRWNRPLEREALLRGYTAEAPVSDAFLATWKAAMILGDVMVMANYPDRAAQAADDLELLLATL